MKKIILSMIKEANELDNEEEAYRLINYARQLVDKLTETINCPSNWRDIVEDLKELYDSSDWVYQELELYNY